MNSRHPLVSIPDVGSMDHAWDILGPWEVDAVTEYLQNDHPELVPSAGTQVAELVRSEHVLRQLTFRSKL